MPENIKAFLYTSVRNACTENMYLSSSVVKQIAAFNGDIRHFVPDVLHDEILQRLSKELPT